MKEHNFIWLSDKKPMQLLLTVKKGFTSEASLFWFLWYYWNASQSVSITKISQLKQRKKYSVFIGVLKDDSGFSFTKRKSHFSLASFKQIYNQLSITIFLLKLYPCYQ